MELKKLKDELTAEIKALGYTLYSLSYDDKENILQVLIDESLDLNTISLLSEKISLIMDRYDADFGNYLLDVSSVGIERPIRNEEEVMKAIGSYVFVKTKDFKTNGTLIDFKDGRLSLEYMDKNIKRKAVIEYKDVRQLRFAVKF